MRNILPDGEGAALLHPAGDSSTGWTSRRGLCVIAVTVMAVTGLAAGVATFAGDVESRLGDVPTLPTHLTPAERVVGDPVVSGVETGNWDPQQKPFTAMGGMFAYDGWTQGLFEETQDDRPLLQQLPKYGATVGWAQIKAAINANPIGTSGERKRKLFLFIRHGKATHNEWGREQHHAHSGDDIPCDFREPGDLVDPELTAVGKRDTKRFVRDVFKNGLGAAIGKSVKVFSSPLSRCMQTTLLLLQNQTGLDIVHKKVVVSELLRERIDARVPFELRRPVSFVPESVLKQRAAAASETEKETKAALKPNPKPATNPNSVKPADLAGQGGAKGPGGTCWEPSKGLTGHEGSCCVDEVRISHLPHSAD